MSAAGLREIMAAIAAQLADELGPAYPEIDLQVGSELISNPTPPCLDVYPDTPFVTQTGFGAHEANFIIRARVATADQDAGQGFLLELLDPRSTASVHAALRTDATFDGAVDDSSLHDDSPSGFITYEQPAGGGINSGTLLGCEWRVKVEL